MKREKSGGESIRLTNRTAKLLREQAKRQQFGLRLTAVILTVVLAVLSVVLGMRRILWVPVVLLLAIGMDALLFMCARSRYVQLTGQAICTEAAARIMRGERAEQQRIRRTQRDMEQIREDLAHPPAAYAAKEPDEEDEDLFGAAPSVSARVPAPVSAVRAQEQTPVRRRRRQAKLQVLGDAK